MQLLLLRWTRFYKGIYEMLPSEAPPDDIIEKDAELDEWYKNYCRKMEKDLGVRGANRPNVFEDVKNSIRILGVTDVGLREHQGEVAPGQ